MEPFDVVRQFFFLLPSHYHLLAFTVFLEAVPILQDLDTKLAPWDPTATSPAPSHLKWMPFCPNICQHCQASLLNSQPLNAVPTMNVMWQGQRAEVWNCSACLVLSFCTGRGYDRIYLRFSTFSDLRTYFIYSHYFVLTIPPDSLAFHSDFTWARKRHWMKIFSLGWFRHIKFQLLVILLTFCRCSFGRCATSWLIVCRSRIWGCLAGDTRLLAGRPFTRVAYRLRRC